LNSGGAVSPAARERRHDPVRIPGAAAGGTTGWCASAGRRAPGRPPLALGHQPQDLVSRADHDQNMTDRRGDPAGQGRVAHRDHDAKVDDQAGDDRRDDSVDQEPDPDPTAPGPPCGRRVVDEQRDQDAEAPRRASGGIRMSVPTARWRYRRRPRRGRPAGCVKNSHGRTGSPRPGSCPG
jgi:hypothetical protein